MMYQPKETVLDSAHWFQNPLEWKTPRILPKSAYHLLGDKFPVSIDNSCS